MYSVLSERDTCTLESLIRSERKILSYNRTRTQKDSWIPGKSICICTFHSLSKVYSGSIISPQIGYQMCFPWSVIMTTSLRLQPISRKCRILLQKPSYLDPYISWYFVPSAHRQFYFCFRLCHGAGLCSARAVRLWSEFVVSKYCIYLKLRILRWGISVVYCKHTK